MTWNSAIRNLVFRKKVVLVGRPRNEFDDLAWHLQTAGASGLFYVTNSTGPSRSAVDCPPNVFEADLGYVDENAVRRSTAELVSHPPAGLLSKLNDFDPELEALVITEGRCQETDWLGRRVVDPGLSITLDEKARVFSASGLPWAGREVKPQNHHVDDSLDLEGLGTLWWGGMTGEEGSTHDATWVATSGSPSSMWWELAGRPAQVLPRLSRNVSGGFGFVGSNESILLGTFRPALCVDTTTSRVVRLGSWLESPDANPMSRDAAGQIGTVLLKRGFEGPFQVEGYELSRQLSPIWLSCEQSAEYRRYAQMHGTSWPLMEGVLRSSEIQSPSIPWKFEGDCCQGFLGKLNVPMSPPSKPQVHSWKQLDGASAARAILMAAPEGAALVIQGSFSSDFDVVRCCQSAIDLWQLPVGPLECF